MPRPQSRTTISSVPPSSRIRCRARIATAMPELSMNVTAEKSSVSRSGSARLDLPVEPLQQTLRPVVIQLALQKQLQLPPLAFGRNFHPSTFLCAKK